MVDHSPFDKKRIVYFLKLAICAASNSKDPSTQVGCVLANKDRQVISTGYNGFCRGACDNPAYYSNRAIKLQKVVHAEANAICQCAFNGVSARGTTAFITLHPCLECAKLLKQAGVERIYYLSDHTDNAARERVRNDWRELIDTCDVMLQELGIPTYEVDISELD